MTAQEALSVQGLSVSINTGAKTTAVLTDIALTLPPGKVMGLIGESGSGKTTLANAILGILPASFAVTAGQIRLQGDVLVGSATPQRNARIAYVPQDPSTALDPLFTIGRQIDDLLRFRRDDLRSGKARLACMIEHLQAVRLAEPERLLTRRPHEVSGGQRQRLMIAFALMTRPALIIADEPTTALDLTTQAQILALIRRLASTHNAAVLLTTHDPGVAHEICDIVTVMYRGRIVESAPTACLLRHPKDPYTQRLLSVRARSPITAVPGEVSPSCLYEPVTG